MKVYLIIEIRSDRYEGCDKNISIVLTEKQAKRKVSFLTRKGKNWYTRYFGAGREKDIEGMRPKYRYDEYEVKEPKK